MLIILCCTILNFNFSLLFFQGVPIILSVSGNNLITVDMNKSPKQMVQQVLHDFVTIIKIASTYMHAKTKTCSATILLVLRVLVSTLCSLPHTLSIA